MQVEESKNQDNTLLTDVKRTSKLLNNIKKSSFFIFDPKNQLVEYFISYFCAVQPKFLAIKSLAKMQKSMENRTIQRTLYKVLRKTGVRRDRIKLEASFQDDLNFDQVDWTLFVYYLEGFFKIQLEDQEIRKMSFVNDTIEMVSRRTAV